MEKSKKKRTLSAVAKVTEYVALKGGYFPTWVGFYEPPMPEKLKKMIKKK